MGLEGLALLRGVENEFSIYLSEDEIKDVYTVGNLYNSLLCKLKPTRDCLTSKSFYRIRKAMTEALRLPRSSIGPSTFLDDLFDYKRIREQWSAVARECHLKLPRLRHTAMWKHWMQIASAVLSFVLSLASYRLLSLSL
jgi:hypothetical protein